jgi:hypothetical protein
MKAEPRPRNHRTSFAAPLLATLVAVCACGTSDDQPPPPPPIDTASCFDVAAEIAAACIDKGMNVVLDFNGGTGHVILVDDPSGSIDIGGIGFLIDADADANWVGDYEFDGGDCTVGCSWCDTGQSLCHGGFDSNGQIQCALCLNPAEGDVVQTCTDWLRECNPDGVGGSGGSGAAGGSGGSGAAPPGGSSGAGAGAPGGTEDGDAEYDCESWNPAGAALQDGSGRVFVDRNVVAQITAHFGNPLVCEGTKFRLTESGHYQLSRASSTGVLAQMGLRVGDVLLRSNGVELDSLDAVADLVADMFYGPQIRSQFTLTYERGRRTQQLVVLIE